ncbi:MAG: ABC transporter ATP-binding protein [Chitinispirillaceae bacterium]|nr:ABC transporter ATP-binding protein [Chitinispirillaceae bacterium]
MDAILATGLHKKFETVPALQGVSLRVPQGALFGLIGADGAGKTTLLRILVTLLVPDKGNATVLGSNAATDMHNIRRRVGYMPQRFSLYQDLSVKENLRFFADIFGISASERENRMRTLLSFSRLTDFQDRRAANLSGGMKQKLALSCALIHTPQLLILDEPTTGVDPLSRKEFWDILLDLKRQGITILVSTPYMDEAGFCDTLLLLHKGEVIKEGTPEALLAGYPYRLYRIRSATGSITVSQRLPRPEGAALMYPHAGTLHVALATDGPSPEILLRGIKSLVPYADTIEKVEADIEDLLFALISEKGAS